jgi:hypothetical protein
VSQQGLDGIKLSGQLSFGEECMNLAMAYPVQVLCMPAAFGLGYQVMVIALVSGNFALTQRAHQIHWYIHNPFLLE